MHIRLHANATTTPKTRHYIQASNQSVRQLVNELGVSEDTIRRWKRRDGVADGSHTPHRLQTTLTQAQEVVVVELRKTLLLPLDDLLVVTREFIHPEVSRSGLDRCLRRHGVSNLNPVAPGRKHQAAGEALQGPLCTSMSSTCPSCRTRRNEPTCLSPLIRHPLGLRRSQQPLLAASSSV